MRTRTARTVGAVAAVGLALAGWTAPVAGSALTGADLPECPADALDDADGPVEVTFWYSETAVAEQAVLELVDAYNASQDRVVVEAQNQTGGTGSTMTTLQKYQGALDADQLPDLVEFYEKEVVPAIDTGTLLPAEACLGAAGLDAIQPGVRAHYTVDGTYWPGYVGITQPLMYFNAEMFTAAGLDPGSPPRTLAELHDAAVALKEAGIESPIALQAITSWHVLSMLAAAGQTVFDHNDGRDGDPEEATFDNPLTHELFEWLVMMQDAGLLASFGGDDNLLAIAAKTAAITFGDTGQASGIAEFLEAGAPEGVTVMSAPIPSIADSEHPAVVSGPGLFIVNESDPEVQAGAWDFMTFLHESEQVITWLTMGSYLPFQTASISDPAVEGYLAGDELTAQLLAPGWDSLQAVDPEVPGPLLINDATRVIDNALQAVMFNGTAPDDAIAAANDELDEVIDLYWGS